MATNYPDNYTGRVRLKYQFNGGPRVLQLRHATSGLPLVDVVAGIRAMLFANRQMWTNDLVWTNAEWIPKDGNIAQPLAWEAVQGNGGTALDAFYWPRFISIVGKSLGGSKVKFSFYGVAGLSNDNSYRLLPSEYPSIVSDFVNDFSAVVIDAPVLANDGGALVLNQYVNVGFNAYYQRKRRRG